MTTANMPETEGVDFMSMAHTLVKRRKLVASITGGVAVLAIAASLMLPEKFTATSRVALPENPESIGALGAISELTAVAGLGGGQKPGDYFVGVLQSQRVADSIIQKFDLKKVYKVDTLTDARKKLQADSNIGLGKGDIIQIEVTALDAKLSAAVANAYADELTATVRTLRDNGAKTRSEFFEKKLAESKTKLTKAHENLKNARERTGILELQGQTETAMMAVASLQGQIAAKDALLQSLRVNYTDENPQVRAVRAEIGSLRAELANRQQATKGADGLAANSIVFLDAAREAKFAEIVYDTMLKQYEAAQATNIKTAEVVQVLDSATVPDKRSSPRRGLLVILSTMAAGLLSVFLALALESFANASRRRPELVEAIRAELKGAK